MLMKYCIHSISNFCGVIGNSYIICNTKQELNILKNYINSLCFIKVIATWTIKPKQNVKKA